MLLSSIRMHRKSASIPCVYVIGARPGPTAKLCALVITHRLVQFRLGIHHEGTVLGHWLADWAALQQQQFCLGIAIVQQNFCI